MVDKKHDKGVPFRGEESVSDTPGPGLPREAVKPLEERASGESGRKDQVEENPHNQEDENQPKIRKFSGDVRRPGSPDIG